MNGLVITEPETLTLVMTIPSCQFALLSLQQVVLSICAAMRRCNPWPCSANCCHGGSPVNRSFPFSM